MKRTIAAAAALAAASLSLTACGGSSGTDADDDKTLTISGWSLETTPEFQKLADGFEAANPGYQVEVEEYEADNYNTLLTADLAAGKGPDVITQKEVKFLPTFVKGDQLLDVSDVEVPDGLGGVESYQVDGKTYAVPYRQDSWVMFYNKDLIEKAKGTVPDGSWTWDDYLANLETLKGGLPSGSYPAYQHTWQSTVQGLANAQADADILAGDYGYLEPTYERLLTQQKDELQVDFNTASSNQLTYQAEFGKQKAATMLMGTWYVATLVSQQASGEADTFEWGIAPAPQADASTTGTEATPVTFGDPTGFGVNANISEGKVEIAKKFLAYAASEDAAKTLAGIGITPALTNDAVVAAFTGVEGTPTDELSTFTWSTHETRAENPTSEKTAAVQEILNELNTAVLSGSSSIQEAIGAAEKRFANEIGAS